MKSIEIKRKVRWADVDASGRIYFARIFDYACEGEWELLHSNGIVAEGIGKNVRFPPRSCRMPFQEDAGTGRAVHTPAFGRPNSDGLPFDTALKSMLEKDPHEVSRHRQPHDRCYPQRKARRNSALRFEALSAD